MWESFGKTFLFIGAIMLALGGIMLVGGRLFGLGRLPGDIFIQKGNFSFYFPVMTGIILSILLTIILNIFRR
ncbi:MAG: DUF2905 domain-containing protein [Desulfotomaculaceae bacterium]|nr:DUF2905 domain-containing protein [Desulfotomaculaceae bacterium]